MTRDINAVPAVEEVYHTCCAVSCCYSATPVRVIILCSPMGVAGSLIPCSSNGPRSLIRGGVCRSLRRTFRCPECVCLVPSLRICWVTLVGHLH
jgi:hypothetical protein